MTRVDTEMDVEQVGELYRSHVNRTHALTAAVMAPHVEVRAEGSIVYDESGQDYLDVGGHGVFLLGHRHPEIVAAVQRQLEVGPLQARFLLNPVIARAAGSLARVTPEGLEYVFMHCAGAEVVEMAIKLARLAGRRRIVATEGGFHGKSTGALAVTAPALYRAPFEPLLPDVLHIPYGDSDALEAVLAEHPGECVFFVEPVQGEGGVRIPPRGYLSAVEAACRRHGAVLVLDEIQTGLGRLGRFWGADAEDVRPDVLLSGKMLGGGVLPVSALVATAELYEPLNADPYLHSATFANSPIMAAAAAATIEVLETTDVIDRAASIGANLLEELRALAGDVGEGVVSEVRGAGLLLGIEFNEPGQAGEFIFGLLARRVLPSYSLGSGTTIRITPSALISETQRDRLLDGVAGALQHVRDTGMGG